MVVLILIEVSRFLTVCRAHVAVVVEDKKLTTYLNGKKVSVHQLPLR